MWVSIKITKMRVMSRHGNPALSLRGACDEAIQRSTLIRNRSGLLRRKLLAMTGCFWKIHVAFGILFCNIAIAHPNLNSATHTTNNTQSPRTKIIFWHSMAGNLGDAVAVIAQKFNQSQQEYELQPIYKGSYNEVFTSTVAAFRAQQHPHLVQIFEIGTNTMLYPSGITIPIWQVMSEAGLTFSTKQLLPGLAHYYSDQQGRLLAMPFNSSSAVMFFNKDAFSQAGLDPAKPPSTWPELERVARVFKQAGYRCGFTTAYPSWIQLESFSAWHNIALASDGNGFNGLAARANFAHPLLRFHIDKLRQWQKEGIFHYGGRGDNATPLFTSGSCPILFQSSGALMSFLQTVKFGLGTAPLPYWSHVVGAPQNTLMGGAAIWVMARHEPTIYRGAAKFLAFLMTTDVQLYWQRATGYLPLTNAAFTQSQHNKFYQQFPGAMTAIESLHHKSVSANSQGVRLGFYSQIREITDDALEASWAEVKPTQQALIDATKRSNELLQRFQQNSEIK